MCLARNLRGVPYCGVPCNSVILCNKCFFFDVAYAFLHPALTRTNIFDMRHVPSVGDICRTEAEAEANEAHAGAHTDAVEVGRTAS
jgi:hypothetical protein